MIGGAADQNDPSVLNRPVLVCQHRPCRADAVVLRIQQQMFKPVRLHDFRVIIQEHEIFAGRLRRERVDESGKWNPPASGMFLTGYELRICIACGSRVSLSPIRTSKLG